jgi:hypothetical protein
MRLLRLNPRPSCQWFEMNVRDRWRLASFTRLPKPNRRLRRPLVLERLPNRGGGRPHYGLTLATLVIAVQHDVHTSTTTVTWILTGYLLSACVATPILSRFGDMFGKARMAQQSSPNSA